MSSADDDRAPLIDPAILAERRAKRAEIAEEQIAEQLVAARREADRLQGRADALSGELELARERRDELTHRVEALQRDLRFAQQREHSERQLRIETQDDLAQARRDTAGARDEAQSRVRDAHQRADELERELHHSHRDVDHAQGLIERHAAARARAETAAAEDRELRVRALEELTTVRDGAVAENAELRAEAERRAELQDSFATQVTAFRDELEVLREREATGAARQALARAALRDVIDAAARMRARLDQAQLLRAEAQERLAITREQLDERDEEVLRARRELEETTVEVASLRAQLDSERGRADAALDAAGGDLRAQLTEQAAAYEAALASMRDQLQAAFEAQPGAPIGVSPREAELDAAVARLTEEVRSLRARTAAQAAHERELAVLVGEIVTTAGAVREGYEHELERVEGRIAAERDLHEADRARLEAQLAERADAQDAAADALGAAGAQLSDITTTREAAPAGAEAVIADLARAAQRLRSASAPLVDQPPGAEADSEPREPEPAVERRWAPLVTAPRAPGTATGWLTPALAALAARDRAVAAQTLVALLALQGRTGRSVVYDLTIPDTGVWRVAVDHGAADIVRDARRARDGDSAFSVTGSVEDLAVLAGGGRAGLGPGARVAGSRRQARRLLRAGRTPVGLADAALLLSPGQALALLAAAPTPPAGAPSPVSLQLTTPAGDTWHLVVDGGGLRTGAGPDPSGPDTVHAVLRGSAVDLVALLGGASTHRVSVSGDGRAAHAMMDWVTAIQGV